MVVASSQKECLRIVLFLALLEKLEVIASQKQQPARFVHAVSWHVLLFLSPVQSSLCHDALSHMLILNSFDLPDGNENKVTGLFYRLCYRATF